jgi:hypothetical protein
MKSSFFRGALPKIAGQARQTALLTKTPERERLGHCGAPPFKGQNDKKERIDDSRFRTPLLKRTELIDQRFLLTVKTGQL